MSQEKSDRFSLRTMLDHPLTYKVVGMPAFACTMAHLIFVVISRECIAILTIVGMLIATALTIPMALTDTSYYLLLPWALLPFVVILISVFVLMALVIAIGLLRPDQSPIRLYSSIVNVLSTCGLLYILSHYTFLDRILNSNSELARTYLAYALPAGYLVISEILHLLYFNYLVPVGGTRWREMAAKARMRAWTGSLKPALTEASEQVIEIGDRNFPIDVIRSIEAEGNYIHLTTTTEHALIRATFTTALKALPQHIGVQVHRSRWVAFAAISGVDRQGKGLLVRLNNGASFQVPRSRADTVETTLAANKIFVDQPIGASPSKDQAAKI